MVNIGSVAQAPAIATATVPVASPPQGRVKDRFINALTAQPQTMRQLMAKVNHPETVYNLLNGLHKKGEIGKCTSGYYLLG